MNRVWDYAGFAVWFVGLGYIMLWLADADDSRALSPTLQAVGVAAACFVAVRLALLAVARWRGRAGGGGKIHPARRADVAMPQTRPAPPRRLPTVKPRRHFGLRGGPH